MRDATPKIAELACGKWRGIFLTLGISDSALKNKHGPCPLCGVNDRFRWDNKEGRGTFICNQCGAGDGMDLVMKLRNCGYAEAARAVEAVIGAIKLTDRIAPVVSEADREKLIRAVLATCHPVEKGDDVDRYMAGRGVDEPKQYPADLLTCERCRFEEGVYFTAMIGIIRDPSGLIPTYGTLCFLRR